MINNTNIIKQLDKNNRFYWMGLAMLWIILFHMFYPLNPLGQQTILSKTMLYQHFLGGGYLGVDIFLFISGYGLAYSYENNNLTTFYKNRFNRLYPMYIFFIVPFIFYFSHWQGYNEYLRVLLFNITGLSNFTKTNIVWYIPAIILIYAIYPLLYIFTKYLYSKSALLLCIFILLIEAIKPLTSLVIEPNLSGRTTDVIMGIITYLCVKENDNIKLLSYYIYFVLLAFTFLASRSESAKMLIPIILYTIGSLDIKLPFLKAISFIGKHTLEIYLAQCIAIEQIHPKITGIAVLDIIIIAPIQIILTLTIAVLLYYLQNYKKTRCLF